MAVVGFGVLFAGVVSPQAVAASTAALLFFVLPVSEQAPASAIGDRLLGWVLAGVLCIPAALFVWADRWHDPLAVRWVMPPRSVADLLDEAACPVERWPTQRGAALPRRPPLPVRGDSLPPHRCRPDGRRPHQSGGATRMGRVPGDRRHRSATADRGA